MAAQTKAHAMFARRRKQLMRIAGDEAILVLAAAPERIRSRDTHFPYRQDSDFWYLTGFGATTGSGDEVPAVGDGCPGNSGLGAVTAVEQTSGGEGGLYAVWNGERRLLTLTVVTTEG